jgi:predicted short-subunit dehydrogenase-like oxidoreductase (DUF2520 family)
VGQVPERSPLPIGIVGDGRAARHLAHYLNLLNHPVRTWSRRHATLSPYRALLDCGTVLLLINDVAIEPFVDAWPALSSHMLVHCSGTLVTSVARVAHPLMSFGETLYDLDTYLQIPFIIDADGPPFDSLLPHLPNPSFRMRSVDRPLYHALCVLAGTGSALLWHKLFTELESRFNIPRTAAFPYLQRVAANLQQDSRRALTGPVTRGDYETVRANLATLQSDPYHAVYAAFARIHAERT